MRLCSTGVLGKPGTRRLRAPVLGLNISMTALGSRRMKYTDLDEVTGRIMVVVGLVSGRRQDNIPYARQSSIADLPT